MYYKGIYMITASTKTQNKKTESAAKPPLTGEEDVFVEEMMEKGVHLGHHISRLHPKMASFVIGIRNTAHIIDLRKTREKLQQALNFLEGVFENGGAVLFVGTKIPVGELVKKMARQMEMPYVSDRWLGGTFTNFETMKKRIKYYVQLKEKTEKGDFSFLPKKEQRRRERELHKLSVKFEGIKSLEKLPEAVFVCDIVKDDICVREARRVGVPVVAIVDTNANPETVDYPIPANDDALTSVEYILEKVKALTEKSEKSNKK